MISKQLRAQWVSACGGHDGAEQTLNRVIADYSAPARRYHNVHHVTKVVERVNQLVTEPDSALPAHAAESIHGDIVLAAWFHDVVYNPTKSDNEEMSARRAEADLAALDLETHRTRRIAALVRMTADHRCSEPAAGILADADLWTLGGSTEDYFAYGALIRAEYIHVPETAWRSGRAAFIDRFLARDQIFHTERGLREREHQARHNLAQEYARLQ